MSIVLLRRLIILITIGVAIVACQNEPQPTAASPTATVVAAVATEAEIAASPSPTETATPVPSATPTATGTPTATNTPPPTPTNTPTVTPTPQPILRQLTSNGCCTQPSFSPEGDQVLFIDKPSQNAPVGIYGVTIASPENEPQLISEMIGFRSDDRSIVATTDGTLIQLTREESGESWTLDTGGNWPNFSPDGQSIAWVASDREGPFDRRRSDIWLADVSGENRQLLFPTYGARGIDWLPDSQRMLVIGRDAPLDEERILFVYDVRNGQRTNLFSHQQIRGGQVSPGGRWVAIFLTFADDPSENGLWLVEIATGQRTKVELPTFGSYRWRDDSSLLFIPFRESQSESMQLWQIDIESGSIGPITDPATVPFSISNGDWEVGPDGRQIVFVSSFDQNIWHIQLP